MDGECLHVHITSCVHEGHTDAALLKQHVPSRWRGDYGGKKQLWFPANYVEELPSSPVRELDEAVGSDPINTFSSPCLFQS